MTKKRHLTKNTISRLMVGMVLIAVITTLSGLSRVNAQPTIENPGFETGDLTGWSFSDAGKTSIATDKKFSGNYAVLVKGQNSIQTTVTGLNENTTYDFSFMAYNTYPASDEKKQLLFYVEGATQMVVATEIVSSDAWVELAGQFTTGAGQTSIEVGAKNEGFFWGYYDSLIVTEAGAVEIIDVTGVALDQETASVDEGNTLQLTATVEPENATNKTVTWSTDDELIATVDENGLVTGVGEGVTTITVTTNDQGLTASCAITVNAASSYTLTLSSVGNGVIKVNGIEYTDPVTVSSSEEVSITVFPDEGWGFEGWTGDIVSADTPLVFIPDADKNITCTFYELTQYTLTLGLVAGNGTLMVNGAEYTDVITAYEGTVFNLSAIPESGWQFNGWSEGLTTFAMHTDISLDSNITANATFEEIPEGHYRYLRFTVREEGEESTRISHITWLSEGVEYQNENNPLGGVTYTTTGNNKSAHILNGRWDAGIAENGGVELPVSMTMELTKGIVPDGVKIRSLAATKRSPASFICHASNDLLSWDSLFSKSGLTESDYLANDYVTFMFVNEYSLSVSAENGSVAISPDKTIFTEGTSVTLTATADEGYEFMGWTGDASGMENPLEITMDSEKSITATFTEIAPTEYTLTINITGTGTVTVNDVEYTEPVSFEEGTALTIVASATGDYIFQGWSGDLSSVNQSETITLDSDKTINATFDFVESIHESGIVSTVYPNPFNESIYVESKSAIQKITIVNSIGVSIVSFNPEGKYNTKLPVSNLKRGLYFIIFEDVAGNERVEKLCKE